MVKRHYALIIGISFLVPMHIALAQSGNFWLSFTPSNGSIVQGGKTSASLNIMGSTATTGTNKPPVTLVVSTGLPAGLSVTFAPGSCAPPCNAIMNITAAGTVSPGVYNIQIIGAAVGQTAETSFALVITAPAVIASDFSMTVFPSSNVILKKASVNALINLTSLSGMNQNVALTIANQPASTTVQVSPTSCKPPCNAVLAITTKDNIKVGSYPITILGYGGGITKSVDYNLIVIDSANPGTIGAGSGGVSAWSALPAYTFARSLYRGLRGDDVSRLQQYLAADIDLYPGGSVTGYYGALTEQAVGKFQVKFGITTVGGSGYGLFGPRTRAKMNSLLVR